MPARPPRLRARPLTGQSTFHHIKMAVNDSSRLTDRRYLTEVQYRTQDNFVARQSIYAYQRPKIDLPRSVIATAGLTGAETVADIGCGNGMYLAELARQGHAGRVVGADLSTGMLAAARGAAPGAGLVVGDASVLPLGDNVADVTLAPHMLNHVPDKLAAVREFRRVTRPGGKVLVVLNAADHLAEFRVLAESAAADIGLPGRLLWADAHTDGHGLNLDAGARLLAQEFGQVERHDFVGELVVPGPQPLLDYVASMRFTQSLPKPEELVHALAMRLTGGERRIRTHSGALVCR
jgi:SAM-dependent methyltransferase